MDPFDRELIRLALEIDRLVPGYVDAYIGPPQIRNEVAATDKKDAATLLNDLHRLRDQIPVTTGQRQLYLSALTRAMDCTLRKLDGEHFDYLQEVELLYDIRPQPIEEEQFHDALRRLDDALPSNGTLFDRANDRRKHYELNVDQVLPLLELARQETRQRTLQIVNLIDGEELEIQLTNNQPWSAYNWYKGKGRSLIEFNRDIPISALSLISTFAHEGYPGHHTEHILKEEHLLRRLGYGEEAIFLLHSPAAVIAEGIATSAVGIIFPDAGGLNADARRDYHDWNEQVLLPEVGISGEPALQMRQIAEAIHDLRYVTGNAAILFHTAQLDAQQTIDYITTYALSTPERAKKSFDFISDPLFRSYSFTYTEGYDLLKRAGKGNELALFKRLLFEQILPSQLADGTWNALPASRDA